MIFSFGLNSEAGKTPCYWFQYISMLLGEFIGIIEISMIWGHKFLERMHLHGGCSNTWKSPEQISGLLHQRMGIPKFQPLISGGVGRHLQQTHFGISSNSWRRVGTHPNPWVNGAFKRWKRFTICNLLRDAKGVYFTVGKKKPTLADIYHLKPHMEGILRPACCLKSPPREKSMTSELGTFSH